MRSFTKSLFTAFVALLSTSMAFGCIKTQVGDGRTFASGSLVVIYAFLDGEPCSAPVKIEREEILNPYSFVINRISGPNGTLDRVNTHSSVLSRVLMREEQSLLRLQDGLYEIVTYNGDHQLEKIYFSMGAASKVENFPTLTFGPQVPRIVLPYVRSFGITKNGIRYSQPDLGSNPLTANGYAYQIQAGGKVVYKKTVFNSVDTQTSSFLNLPNVRTGTFEGNWVGANIEHPDFKSEYPTYAVIENDGRSVGGLLIDRADRNSLPY